MENLPNDLRKIAANLEARGVVGAVTLTVAAHHIERVTAERDGEREARHNLDAALRGKEAMFNTIVERAQAAGVDFSDLQS